MLTSVCASTCRVGEVENLRSAAAAIAPALARKNVVTSASRRRAGNWVMTKDRWKPGGKVSAAAELFAGLVQRPFFRGGECAEAVAVDLVENAVDLGADILARRRDLGGRAGERRGHPARTFHPARRLELGARAQGEPVDLVEVAIVAPADQHAAEMRR